MGVYFLISLWVKAQTPIHDYELNDSYSDVYGGNSMMPNGGTLTPTDYEFDFGQGPNVSGVIDANTYSIELRFTPTIVTDWRKIIDFADRSSDDGLYIQDGMLSFYPIIDGPNGIFTAGTPVKVVLTRDGANNEVRGYVNGVEEWIFTDDLSLATFTGPGNIIHILIDDYLTADRIPHEHSAGSLDYFKIYDYALTPEQVAGICIGIDSDCDAVNDDCDVCPGGDDSGPCNATFLPPLPTLPSYWLCNNNNNSEKIKVCHDGTTLCVSENSAATHLAHGDFLGPCVSCAQNISAPIGNSNFDIADGLEMELTPNPASDVVNIRLQGMVEGEALLTIYDQLGRVVLSQKLAEYTYELPLDLTAANFGTGQYLVQLVSGQETQTETLVID